MLVHRCLMATLNTSKQQQFLTIQQESSIGYSIAVAVLNKSRVSLQYFIAVVTPNFSEQDQYLMLHCCCCS
ncbi:hypothetical protein RRG08_009761 [Elysia crispata]|uniref:Uncharacterized protein n=1 Tax=Elysia crispata TaxID=231223 RepID=A0AAE0YYS2_9GAST|nr:hypothetical protein RRG08_009761 [Elysia crispata]